MGAGTNWLRLHSPVAARNRAFILAPSAIKLSVMCEEPSLPLALTCEAA